MVWSQYCGRRAQVSNQLSPVTCRERQLTRCRTLTNSFSPCGLAVATATDSMVYKSDVYAASGLPSRDWFDEDATAATPTSKRSSSERGRTWGDKAVLVLIGLRLGLDGVNPIYYDSIKVSYQNLPQREGGILADPTGPFYLPPICGYRRRSSFVIILLCRLSGKLALLPRPTSYSTGLPARNASCTVEQSSATSPTSSSSSLSR